MVYLACTRVEDEVQVALAETCLDIAEALEALGQHVEAWGQQLHVGCEQGELAHLGAAR